MSDPEDRSAEVLREALARARGEARTRSSGDARATRSAARRAAKDEAAAATRDEVPVRTQLPGIAPPGREWAEPVGMRAAIERLLGERGWKDRAQAASVLARWDALVGPGVSEHCRPASLRDGELVLVAESTAWATQLRLLAPQLIERLRAELAADLVTRITVRGPNAPSWSHGRLRAPGGRGPRDTYG